MAELITMLTYNLHKVKLYKNALEAAEDEGDLARCQVIRQNL